MREMWFYTRASPPYFPSGTASLASQRPRYRWQSKRPSVAAHMSHTSTRRSKQPSRLQYGDARRGRVGRHGHPPPRVRRVLFIADHGSEKHHEDSSPGIMQCQQRGDMRGVHRRKACVYSYVRGGGIQGSYWRRARERRPATSPAVWRSLLRLTPLCCSTLRRTMSIGSPTPAPTHGRSASVADQGSDMPAQGSRRDCRRARSKSHEKERKKKQKKNKKVREREEAAKGRTDVGESRFRVAARRSSSN